MIKSWVICFFALLLSACMTAKEHRANTQDDTGETLSVGTVQKEIKVGMASSRVAEILGSPNIVTTDEERREVWVYDKFSTNSTVSENRGYGTLIILGAGGGSGSASTSQKTLTVIIKFDKDKNVRDFSYRTTRF